MQYLSYDEYINLGGNLLDLSAFQKNIDRACAMADGRTKGRLAKFEEVPMLAKIVIRDTVDYISSNSVEKPIVSSKSQSAGGVSESESYTIKTAEDYHTDLDRIFEPLSTIYTANGVCLTYRGAMC
jgi:hypothetical protein